jgi:hypothetical protein
VYGPQSHQVFFEGWEGSHLHGDLIILMDTVQVVKEVTRPVRTAGPDGKSVNHVMEPAEGLVGYQACQNC